MKKLVLIVLCGMATMSVYSQLSLGVKAGLNLSSFSNIQTETKAGTGYKAGISAEYMFSKWGINSGIYLSKVGVAYSEGVLKNKDNGINHVTMAVYPEYITVPLSAVYKIPVDNRVKLSFNAGIYWGYGISGGGSIRYDNGRYGISAFEENRIANDPRFSDFILPKANRMDMGAILGIGVDVSNFNISVNYEQGGRNVYDQYPISSNSLDIKNNVLWAGIGYSFTIR